MAAHLSVDGNVFDGSLLDAVFSNMVSTVGSGIESSFPENLTYLSRILFLN